MTGGSIEDLLESVVRSRRFSRVRGTEEKVKDLVGSGFRERQQTFGEQARRHEALILMGGWCGAHTADTTRKKTGMRLRPHVGGCARRGATEKSGQKWCRGGIAS
jgi:hypothetical protein